MGGIDVYTKLAIAFDGADGSTDDYTAETGQTVSLEGTAQLDTAQKKFGTSSLLLDGDSDYATVPDSADWNFGTGAFTVEAWVMCHNLPTALATDKQIFNQYVDAANRTEFKLQYVDGTLYWRLYSTGGVAYSQVADIIADTWYHVAWVRSGNNFYTFQNGVPVGDVYTDADALPDLASALNIGWATAASGFWGGWIDGVRISKGVARWTSEFTPSPYPYTDYKDVGLRIRRGSTTYIIPVQDIAATHKLRICDGATNYGIPLVTTASDFASSLRIYDGAAVKAIAMETV